MGKRGPPPTPTKILELRGSSEKYGRGPDLEAPAGIPEPPMKLDRLGRAAWDDLIAKMSEMGHLAVIDGYALANLCDCWSDYVQVVERLRKEGLTQEFETKGGDWIVKEHPLCGRKNQLLQRLKDGYARFGLTPSDRVGLAPGRPAEKDEKGEFFK